MHANQGMRGLCIAAAAVISLTGLTYSTESAAQSAPYGCACLHNTKVDATIKYRYRWGDRDYKVMSLSKGEAAWMCWTYKDAPKSPELLFQLDVDMTSKANWQTFSIKRAQSKEQSCRAIPASAHYHVGYVANTDRKKIRIFTGKS